MTALLLGATGLVGSHVLPLLVADDRWTRVVTLGRRPMDALAAKHVHHTLDLDRMAAQPELFACDDLFCALGTTAKQTPDEAAYRRIDHDYPLEAARLAHANGATQYLLVSSLGASPRSRLFYTRLKGEVEKAVGAIGFESLSLFRPSQLTGERKEARRGEAQALAVLRVLRPLLIGPLRRYRPTPAEALARVMVDVAAARPPGRHVLEADVILRRANEG